MSTTKTTKTADDRVEVNIPRGGDREDPNLFVAVNGVNYLLPRGKKSRVPKAVADEIARAERARESLYETVDALLEAPMTAGEMIALADRLRPNQYTTADKLRWLERLDGQVLSEVIGTHAEIAPDAASGTAYTAATELLVPFPYAEELYTAYILTQMDLLNAEITRYTQSATQLAAAWRQYADWYNRSHAPLGVRRLKL